MKKIIHRTLIYRTLINLSIIGIIVLSFSLSKAQEIKAFEIKAENYKFSPDTITVNQGDKVIITAVAVDKDHGLGIKAFDIDQSLQKGELTNFTFTADKKGEYSIRCTKLCGWKHPWMNGKLIVK